jgi:hypothetical protein
MRERNSSGIVKRCDAWRWADLRFGGSNPMKLAQRLLKSKHDCDACQSPLAASRPDWGPNASDARRQNRRTDE